MKIWYDSYDELMSDIERSLDMGEESFTVNERGMRVLLGDSSFLESKVSALENRSMEAAGVIGDLTRSMDEIRKLLCGRITKDIKSDIEDWLNEMDNDIEYALHELEMI